MKCARVWIHTIGGPVCVCDRPDAHGGACHGRPRDKRSGEVVPGPVAHWVSDRSHRVAGEYVRRPELLTAGEAAA